MRSASNDALQPGSTFATLQLQLAAILPAPPNRSLLEERMEGFVLLLFIGGIGAILNALLASARGREPGLWAFIGFFFGIISLLILAVMPNLKEQTGPVYLTRDPPNPPQDPTDTARQNEEPSINSETKICPQCAETVKFAARICRYCRYEFPPDPLLISENEFEEATNEPQTTQNLSRSPSTSDTSASHLAPSLFVATRLEEQQPKQEPAAKAPVINDSESQPQKNAAKERKSPSGLLSIIVIIIGFPIVLFIAFFISDQLSDTEYYSSSIGMSISECRSVVTALGMSNDAANSKCSERVPKKKSTSNITEPAIAPPVVQRDYSRLATQIEVQNVRALALQNFRQPGVQKIGPQMIRNPDGSICGSITARELPRNNFGAATFIIGADRKLLAVDQDEDGFRRYYGREACRDRLIRKPGEDLLNEVLNQSF